MRKLFTDLNRRGVTRVVLAYLAVSWLVLQVINELRDGILELPVWLPPFAFYALLIGFPIVVVVAWIYDLTPQGIVSSDDCAIKKPPVRFGARKVDFLIIGSLTLVVALLGSRLLIRSDEQGLSIISEYEQLTSSRILLPPAQSPYPILSDGFWLYLNDFSNGDLDVRRLPRSGGFAETINSPFDKGVLMNPAAMTPDGEYLVVNAFNPTAGMPPEIYHVPISGGAPRQIGNGWDVSYSADGSQIVFARFTDSGAQELAIANPDLTASRTIATVQGGRIHWPRFSPDGQTIRYTLQSLNREIFEVSVDGGEPHRLFPEGGFVDYCCGNWTPNGSDYVFQATSAGRTQLWAIQHPARDVDFGQAVQITAGPIDIHRPTFSADGNQIFAIGWQLRGELVRFDAEADRLVPLDGYSSESAEWLHFSSDGELAAYVSYPEAELWISGRDGSRRLQLSFGPMRSKDPVWSPDDEHIAFEGRVPGEPPRIYIVTTDGNPPIPVSDSDRTQRSPSWSPDGSKLIFNEFDNEGRSALRLFDVATATVSNVIRSEGLGAPNFTADGNIVAIDQGKFVVYNFESGERYVVAENIPFDYFEVSRDGNFIFVVGPLLNPADTDYEPPVFRVTIADGSTETITTLNADERIAWGVEGPWVGFTTDGYPMMLRDLSIHHVYALDWSANTSKD